jgi:hypothetical protein
MEVDSAREVVLASLSTVSASALDQVDNATRPVASMGPAGPHMRIEPRCYPRHVSESGRSTVQSQCRPQQRACSDEHPIARMGGWAPTHVG